MEKRFDLRLGVSLLSARIWGHHTELTFVGINTNSTPLAVLRMAIPSPAPFDPIST